MKDGNQKVHPKNDNMEKKKRWRRYKNKNKNNKKIKIIKTTTLTKKWTNKVN